MRVRSIEIGVLASITLVLVVGSSRMNSTRARMKALESALAFFEMDNGRLPTTEEGLAALVRSPPALSATYRQGGYLQGGRVPTDAWGDPFHYECPPQRNTTGFDLWSLGADGVPGGTGIDADVGNWPGGIPEYEPESRWPFLAAGAVAGFVLGLPIYVVGCLLAVRRGSAWRPALTGAPLAALVYLTAAGGVAVFVLSFGSIS